MDQFTYAERATDWRGNNNIAESIFDQLSLERFPDPALDRGRRRHRRHERDHRTLRPLPPSRDRASRWSTRRTRPSSRAGSTTTDQATGGGSRIEGIGRPRVEPSFVRGVVDRMIRVPDAASIAAARAVEPILGRRVGASTGTNLWGAVQLACEMRAAREPGSIVTLLCDGGERYGHTYFSDDWVRAQGLELAPYIASFTEALTTGEWSAG